MRDVAKCAGHKCTLRDGCDRFVRPAVDRQEWLVPTWEADDEGVESPFWSLGKWRCVDMVTLAVQPHGGAIEEGDGA